MPEPDPAPAPIALICPCCKSGVTFSAGALSGGEESEELKALRTDREKCAQLETQLAKATRELEELRTPAPAPVAANASGRWSW